MRGLRPSAALGLATLLVGPAAGPASGQEPSDSIRVATATLSATVLPDRDEVQVRLDYVLEGRPVGGDGAIRVHALGIGGTEIEEAHVETGGGPGEAGGTSLELVPEQGVLGSAVLDLQAGIENGFALRYRVRNAVERVEEEHVRVRLPLLVLDLPQSGTTRSTFEATIEVPAEWRVSAAFPSGLAATAPGVWTGDLQVVPSFVSLRARTDGRWRPGLPWALDFATVLVLAGVGFVGWRHLSGVVREARA